MGGKTGQLNNYWTTGELETLRRTYQVGGIKAAAEALPHRSVYQIKGAANRYQVYMVNRKRYQKVGTTEHIDSAIKTAYATATRSPNLSALARSVGRSKGWVKYRAMELGVCRPATGGVGIPCSAWIEEEDALLTDLIERGLSASVISKRFAKAGYRRSPTAIRGRISLLDLHFSRPYLTASEIGRLLGIEQKSVARWIEGGLLKAKKVRGPSCDDLNVTKIHYWGVDRKNLAEFLVRYPNHWSHRRVTHTATLIELLFPGMTRFGHINPKDEPVHSAFAEERAVACP